MTDTWHNQPMMAFDLETTGLDPLEDRIVQYGLYIDFDGGPRTNMAILNAEVDIPDEAAAVHGITTEIMKEQGIPYEEGLQDVANAFDWAWEKDVPLVIYNARFDWPFIKFQCDYAGIELKQPLILDPLILDKWTDKWRKGSRKLTAVSEYMGIELENAHDALADAEATVKVMRQIAKHSKLRHVGLEQLQSIQATAYDENTIGLRKWLASRGEDVSNMTLGWPMPSTEEV